MATTTVVWILVGVLLAGLSRALDDDVQPRWLKLHVKWKIVITTALAIGVVVQQAVMNGKPWKESLLEALVATGPALIVQVLDALFTVPAPAVALPSVSAPPDHG